MATPGVHIETLQNLAMYTRAQLDLACKVAELLGRGKLVIVEPPARR